MGDTEEYKKLLTDIIAKQSAILGPHIAILKARGVHELTVTDDGVVTGISGDAGAAMEKLIDAYASLAGQIVKSTLGSVFEKYPSIKK